MTPKWFMGGAFAFMLAECLFAQQKAAIPLPVTHGKTLSGAPVTLPALDHAYTLVVAGFSKASSPAVKAWWTHAEEICAAHADLVCYDAAVLQDAPGMLRGIIVSGMKHDLSLKEQESFVPIFENEGAWKSSFGYSESDNAYLALFDKDGNVVWRTSGGVAQANSAEIQKGLSSGLR